MLPMPGISTGGGGFSGSSSATGGRQQTGNKSFGSTWGSINNSLPWYVWLIIGLLVLAVIVVGVFS